MTDLTFKQCLKDRHDKDIKYLENCIDAAELNLKKLKNELEIEKKNGPDEFVNGELDKNDQELIFNDMVENLLDTVPLHMIFGALDKVDNIDYCYRKADKQMPTWFIEKYKAKKSDILWSHSR